MWNDAETGKGGCGDVMKVRVVDNLRARATESALWHDIEVEERGRRFRRKIRRGEGEEEGKEKKQEKEKEK